MEGLACGEEDQSGLKHWEDSIRMGLCRKFAESVIGLEKDLVQEVALAKSRSFPSSSTLTLIREL